MFSMHSKSQVPHHMVPAVLLRGPLSVTFLSLQLAAQQAPSVFDVHKEEPEQQAAIKAEPKTKEETPSIVSKWSLVDYDNDDDENAVE